MYLSTTKYNLIRINLIFNEISINYNPVYRETVRQPIKVAEFFKGKPEDLQKYRETWTKRAHLFETTYSNETDKVAKEIIASYESKTKK